MILPKMRETAKTRVFERKFGGLYRTETVPDGGMTDMEGVSVGEYPALVTREAVKFGPRFTYGCNGLFAADDLLWVDGTLLYYGGTAMPVLLTDCPKTFAAMGSGVYIFPDKLRFDTETFAVSYLENQTISRGVSVSLCDDDGQPVTDYVVSAGAPENPVNGMLWLDTSAAECEMKQYSEASLAWLPVSFVSVCLGADGIGHGFRKGDCVSVTGLEQTALCGSGEIRSCGEDFISYAGLVSQPYEDEGTVTVTRSVPDMDFICERGNRLWGCAADGHEIYACALGDATNWQRYQGLSTDSYAVTVGSAGRFTGCAAHADAVCFFKETEVLRVYGTKPANFRISAVHAPGLAADSPGSAASVNETLYYMSPEGVMRCDTSEIPVKIGQSLGREPIAGAFGCAAPDGRYFLCHAGELLSFDPQTGFWARDAAVSAVRPVRLGGCVYAEADGRLVCLAGRPDPAFGLWEEEANRVCYFVTGDFGCDTLEKKRLGGLGLRVKLEKDAELTVFTMYDSDGVWRRAGRVKGTGRKAPVTVPILPRRCDHMRLRVEWTGRAAVYGLIVTEER